MNITVIAVGKLKEAFWVSACAEYLKRLSAYAKVTVREVADVDPARAGGDAAAVEREGEGVCAALAKLPERTHVVLLDIRGRERSSEELADWLQAGAVAGSGDFTFIIGSSHGIAPAVKQRAELKLSMSKMTFPHQLARLMLLEQIYRALSILAGSKYHK